MSEVRRDGYNYHNTYVESVEWQRDKAYARAEKAERELEMVGKKHQLALEAAWGERNAAEARAEKAEREVATLAMELRASKTHGTEMFDKAVDQMNRAEKAERERDEANAAIMNIRELHFKDGNLDAAVGGEGATAIAMTLVGFYKAQGGANYVEMQLADKNTGERYTVTVQRVAGKTPHELRTAAEARAEKLAAALRFYADPQSYGISGGSCQRVISDAGRIAARALAETEGEKRVEG